VPSEPAGRGVDPGRAWDGRDPREHPTLVQEVWTGVRQAAPEAAQETLGIWRRCSSGSMVSFTTSGGPSTSTVSCSTSWSRTGGMPQRPSASSNGCCKGCATSRDASSPTACAAIAQRELPPDVEHHQVRYLNNRAENSHRPTRRRERQMQSFKSSAQAQRSLSAYGMIYGHFRPRRHLMTASDYRRARTKIFRIWQQETCAQVAA
jgi:DDE domain